jgi:4-carboxymuconolactone decarboxylase
MTIYGYVITAALFTAVGWFAAAGGNTAAVGKEPRFPQLTMQDLNDRQRPLGEAIMKISKVGIAGPYNPMLRSPVFGQRMFDLLAYLRWDTSVPLRLNEFAILIIGRQWRSQVEWYAHGPLAEKAGLSPGIIAELKADKRPSNMVADEEAVYDFITELTTKRAVSDATFARARKRRAAGRRPHRRRRNLHHRRHAARHGGGNRAARRGAAVQAGRAVRFPKQLR